MTKFLMSPLKVIEKDFFLKSHVRKIQSIPSITQNAHWNVLQNLVNLKKYLPKFGLKLLSQPFS